MDSLRTAATAEDCWARGVAAFQACGSAYLTAGTAPRHTMSALAIRTTTPTVLMSDYLADRIFLADPWMHLCRGDALIDEMDVRATLCAAAEDGKRRMSQLFNAHGIHHAMLLPAYGGQRPGGFVVYADTQDGAEAFGADPYRQRLAMLSAALSAHYRPEMQDPALGRAEGHFRVNDPLSPREREALKWLASGLRTAQIAARMGIEPVTVNKHFLCAKRKLRARTREQALVIALRDGFLPFQV